jgi:thiol:disulfide interchange protein DsbD
MPLWVLNSVLALLVLVGQSAGAEELLEPEQAFRLSATIKEPTQVEVRARIADGYFLYREKFRFSLSGGGQLGDARFPPGKIKEDEYFGRVETYRGDIRIPIALSGVKAGQTLSLSVVSQGCADLGVCYPPQTQVVALRVPEPAAPRDAGTSGGIVQSGGGDVSPGTLPTTPQTLASGNPAQGRVAKTEAPPSSLNLSAYDDAAQVEALLAKGATVWVLLGFLAAGLLLAFTPCMLPMLPILSGLIVGHGQTVTSRRGFALSLAYVLGMAGTYAIAGVVAAATGGLVSSALQNPWVLGAFSAIFVLLALSMFGVYHLQLPHRLQAALRHQTSRLPGGRYVAVAVMGVLSGLIVGPCVAAPLAGALIYIGKTGDMVLGGGALFVMGLGMGAPLLVVGASAGSVLPKAGPWMETVQRVFGWFLLAVAIWIVSPVLSSGVQMAAWGALAIAAAVYLRALDGLPAEVSGWTRLGKALGIMLLLAGAAEWLGALSGASDLLQPLSGLRAVPARAVASETRFQRVRDLAELDRVLGDGRGRPVMLDFYADWCVSCKEMERFTFSDPGVEARLRNIRLLQADVTASDQASKALLKRFGLYGPPGIVFFDARGQVLESPRVIGFEPPERFLASLDRAGI